MFSHSENPIFRLLVKIFNYVGLPASSFDLYLNFFKKYYVISIEAIFTFWLKANVTIIYESLSDFNG